MGLTDYPDVSFIYHGVTSSLFGLGMALDALDERRSWEEHQKADTTSITSQQRPHVKLHAPLMQSSV